MATSGSYSFSVTRNDIVRRAILLIKSVDRRAAIDAQVMADALRSLNSMVDRLRKKGAHVWKLEEIVLFPQPGQRRYQVSTDSSDHVAFAYYQTSLTAAAASGATVLAVTAVSGLRVGDALGVISIGDQIGALLDSGAVSWSTVASLNGTTVTLTSGLSGATSVGRQVWNYHSTATCAVPRPVDIGRGDGSVRRHDFVSLIDTPIGPCQSRLDYDNMPNKDGPGIVNQAYYDLQLSAGFISLWQVPPTVQHLMKFTAQIPIQDFVNPTDTPDLPNEWIDALVFNLAVMMAPEFAVPMDKLAWLEGKANEFLADVMTDDREGESLFMQPDLNR